MNYAAFSLEQIYRSQVTKIDIYMDCVYTRVFKINMGSGWKPIKMKTALILYI